jgi:hypothetical protein
VTLDRVTGFFQIAFWVVVAFVTISTYLHAKRTVFQPLRTEIFKKQIEEMAAVLRVFVGRTELELRKDWDFDYLFDANVEMMYDAYARFAFDAKIDADKRKYRREACPVSLVKPKFLMPVDEHIAESEAHTPDNDASAENKVWEYEHPEIAVPRGFIKTQDEMRTLLESPILPTKMASLIEEYIHAVENNMVRIWELIDECAKEMPQKYPSLDTLSRARHSWIHVRYIKGMDNLEPYADRIIKYVRDYFGSDCLFGRR